MKRQTKSDRRLQRVVPREGAKTATSLSGAEQLAVPRNSCPVCDGYGQLMLCHSRRWVECSHCKGEGSVARNKKAET